MVFGYNCNLICANLVGGIAVGRDTIGAHHYGGYVSSAKQDGDHAVKDQCCWNFVVHQLEGSQAGTLVVWSRFGAVHVLQSFQLMQLANNSKSSTIAEMS